MVVNEMPGSNEKSYISGMRCKHFTGFGRNNFAPTPHCNHNAANLNCSFQDELQRGLSRNGEK